MSTDAVTRANALLVKLNPKFGVPSPFQEVAVGRYSDGHSHGGYIEISEGALCALLDEANRLTNIANLAARYSYSGSDSDRRALNAALNTHTVTSS